MMSAVADKIRDYIFRRYPVLQAKGLGDNDSLVGVLDSLAVLGLVGYIEPEFSIELSPFDLTDENFETVVTISRLVERKRSAG
ncbi:MAG: acyl carrier protein [Acidobacteriia bacterium]|nr:acyl carrier protein [Terriglobia bacterium]